MLRMDPLARLLVAVDGSPASDAAARFAIALARGRGGALYFLSVVDLPRLAAETSGAEIAPTVTDDAVGAARATGRELVDEIAGEGGGGIAAEGGVVEGDPVDEILACAGRWRATCIVMGTHGRSGLARAILGSRTEDVLRRSVVPVLVVHDRTAGERAASLARIVCALDGAPPSGAAFEAALALARERGAALEVFTVVPVDDTIATGYERDRFDPEGSVSPLYREAQARLAPFADAARAAGVNVVADVVGADDVAKAIVSRAADRAADLIAIGSHGRHGIERAWLGSVAEAVIRGSVIPVLAVRRPG
jgi:nucleotide-binding universal stress UspA family protein